MTFRSRQFLDLASGQDCQARILGICSLVTVGGNVPRGTARKSLPNVLAHDGVMRR